jgi:hypothetical protein
MQLLMGLSRFAEQQSHGVEHISDSVPCVCELPATQVPQHRVGSRRSVCLDSCLQWYSCRGPECVHIIIMMCPTL